MLPKEEEYTVRTSDLSEYAGAAIRTMGCCLLYCQEGRAILSANFERRVFRRGDVAVFFPDTLVVVERTSRTFSTRFIEMSAELSYETTFTLASPVFDVIYDHPVFPTAPHHRRILESWLHQLDFAAGHSSTKNARLMVRNLLQNFFLALETEILSGNYPSAVGAITSTRQLFNRFCQLFNRFCQLLVEHCYTQHEVRFYADRLCITPYYLSRITAKMWKLSPKEMIDHQIIMEMKHLLTTTDLSIKEMADLFHFDTPSYLARYFRRHAGMTPTEFRER